jgi:hypothetical protein
MLEGCDMAVHGMLRPGIEGNYNSMNPQPLSSENYYQIMILPSSLSHHMTHGSQPLLLGSRQP